MVVWVLAVRPCGGYEGSAYGPALELRVCPRRYVIRRWVWIDVRHAMARLVAVWTKNAMIPAPDGGTPANALSLLAGQRLRLLRTLHARLLRFPQQDEVLAVLLARWPELFIGNAILERLAQAGSATDDPGASTASSPDTALVAALEAAEHKIEELQHALVSNRTIGAAVEVLMT